MLTLISDAIIVVCKPEKLQIFPGYTPTMLRILQIRLGTTFDRQTIQHRLKLAHIKTFKVANKERLILHATTTGYGGTVLEPNVPPYCENLRNVLELVSSGFPNDHVVIRVDPIIPTEKGIAVAFDVFKDAIDLGFKRFRVSIIDMYNHVCDRFVDAGLPLPYGYKVFQPNKEQVAAVDDMLIDVKRYYCGKKQAGNPVYRDWY